MKPNRLVDKFSNIITRMLVGMCGIVILYLTMMSLFSTALIEIDGEGFERTFYMKDQAWWLVAVFAVLAAGICILKKRLGSREKQNYRKGMQYILLALFFVCGLAVFLMTMQYPKSDQGKILRIAGEVLDGNFAEFAVGGYMHRYPDQTGIVLVLAGVISLFGTEGYLVVQVVNLFMLTGMVWLMKCIAERLFAERFRNIGTYTLLLFLLFVPIYPYVTFIYGTVPGLFFSVLAIYLELCYFKSRRLTTALAASVCMGVAIVFKTNSLIMAVALAAFLVYDIIVEQKKRETMVFLIMLLLSCSMMTRIANITMEQMTGIPVSEGMPKTAWVAMGLQESNMAPGWWNGFSVNLYEKCGYDYALTNEKAIESIVDNFGFFYHNIKDGVTRMGRKMASQWNNPTFQCYTVNVGRESERELSPVMEGLLTGSGRELLTGYMNVFHSILLLGVMLYFIYAWKHVKIYELLPAVAVLGGFVFHIFWEAKCQYILPYFLLLFPYAVCGYYYVSETVCAKWSALAQGIEKEQQEKVKSEKKQTMTAIFAVVATVVIIYAASKMTVFELTIGINDTPQRLAEYEAIVEER